MNVSPEVSGAIAGAAVTGVLGAFGQWLVKHRPRHVTRAEANKADAEADAARADTAVSIAAAFEKLVGDLREEIDRQDRHIVTLREEGHKLRNRVDGLGRLFKATFQYAETLEGLVVSLGGNLPDRPKIIDAEVDVVAV